MVVTDGTYQVPRYIYTNIVCVRACVLSVFGSTRGSRRTATCFPPFSLAVAELHGRNKEGMKSTKQAWRILRAFATVSKALDWFGQTIMFRLFSFFLHNPGPYLAGK